MRTVLTGYGLPALAGACALLVAQQPEEGATDLVGDGPHAVLRFAITDAASADGKPIPGRLTFLGDGGAQAELFPVVDAAPDRLAVRKNVVYTLSGEGRITVPPGRYGVVASRGLEWSIAATRLELADGEEASWTARLVHEVDTSGWISGDFHLHTLTYSGHGDANLKERIISLVGEGVELAVATDHDHNTDYDPTIAELGAGEALRATTGNEVSTPIGHMNAFPLDPERPVIDSTLTDANELFRLIRAEPNAFGIEPVIQINHPRWRGIDYFTRTGLDPVSATTADPRYSSDFDSLEVLNENAGWGLHDPANDGVETKANLQSVLRDWFHLLDRGHRYAAVGNSDSHTVHYDFAGYPRNFVRSPTDAPSEIDPADVAEAIRDKQVFTTLGPFVELSANGVAMGGDVTAEDGEVTLDVRVQAASWIDCDRVKVFVNGELLRTVEVPRTKEPVRLDTTIDVCLRGRCDRHGTDFLPGGDERADAWIVVLVEGDDPIAPIVQGPDRPVRPVAVTNPIWVDADGDGRWTSPWARAVAACASGDMDRLSSALSASPAQRALVLHAMADLDNEVYVSALLDAFQDTDRRVLLAAVRAVERRPLALMRQLLDPLWARGTEDPYLAVALLRAYAACEDPKLEGRIVEAVERHPGELGRYAEELEPVLRGPRVDEWRVLGYFDAPSEGSISAELGPESDPDPARTYPGRDGKSVAWHELSADPSSGFLDLRAIAAAGESSDNALAFAQTWLHTPEARRVACALGTDDGCRVTLDGKLVYENTNRKGARPLEHLAVLELHAGWNRLLFEVENGEGGFGLYCRILGEGVRVAATPD